MEALDLKPPVHLCLFCRGSCLRKNVFLLTAAPGVGNYWSRLSTVGHLALAGSIKMRVNYLVQGFRFALNYPTGFYPQSHRCFSNHKRNFLQLFPNPQKRLVCPHMTHRVCSWLFPYLSWLIQYSLFDRPPLVLHSARCQKQRRLSLLCLLPPFFYRIPWLPPLLPLLPKITQRTKGIGVRRSGDRMEGRFFPVWGLFLLMKIYTTLQKLSGKLFNPPLSVSEKCICSSEHDTALFPRTAIYNLRQLSLEWRDS